MPFSLYSSPFCAGDAISDQPKKNQKNQPCPDFQGCMRGSAAAVICRRARLGISGPYHSCHQARPLKSTFLEFQHKHRYSEPPVLSQDFEVRGQTRILRCEVVEGGRERVQDSHSMKPKFRNANLLITHVLDSCVKLLAVLHISSTQGRSGDLSVEIATGTRRMIDIIWSLAGEKCGA